VLQEINKKQHSYRVYWAILDLKLSPCVEYCVYSFGYLPGVKITKIWRRGDTQKNTHSILSCLEIRLKSCFCEDVDKPTGSMKGKIYCCSRRTLSMQLCFGRFFSFDLSPINKITRFLFPYRFYQICLGMRISNFCFMSGIKYSQYNFKFMVPCIINNAF
jgi:hypothetical protein